MHCLVYKTRKFHALVHRTMKLLIIKLSSPADQQANEKKGWQQLS